MVKDRVSFVALFFFANALLFRPGPSFGVILYGTGDPNANTSAPIGTLAGSGWQWTGQFGLYNATAVAPNWILAANHIGASVGTQFVLGSTTYTTTATSSISGTDFRLFKVDGLLPLYAPLYTATNEYSKPFVVIGRGKTRGIDVITDTGSGPVLRGWQVGAQDRVQRWGQNYVSGITNDATYGQQLYATFDASGSYSAGANEATLAAGDSSGGMYIDHGGVWKLAGINLGVNGPFSTSPTGSPSFFGAIFDTAGIYSNSTGSWAPATWPSISYYSRVSNKASTLNTTIGMGTWKTNANSTWSGTGNWVGTPPNAVDSSAEFLNAITADRTVTVDMPVTLGTLEFNSPNRAYTLAATGGGQITFDVSSINPYAVIRAQGGTGHTINAPVVINKDLQINLQGVPLTFGAAGSLSNPSGKTITKTGTGSLTISGPQNHGVGASIVLNGGTLTVSTDSGANLAMIVNDGAFVTATTPQHLNNLTINTDGTGILAAGLDQVTVVNQLAVSNSGLLDMTNNALVVHATPATRDAVLQDLTAKLALGSQGGSWTGSTGITSSVAMADESQSWAVGSMLNDSWGNPAFNSFLGEPVGVDDVLLRLTIAGDANLDGEVDFSDAFTLTSNYGIAEANWSKGDFNYDGMVDFSDAFVLVGNYGMSVPLSAMALEGGGQSSGLEITPFSEGATVVPEPGSLVLMMIGLYGLGLARRNLRRRGVLLPSVITR